MRTAGTILLVDSEEDLRIAAKIFLKDIGIEADTVSSLDNLDLSAYKGVISVEGKDRGKPKVEYIDKPYTSEDLLKTVMKLIG